MPAVRDNGGVSETPNSADLPDLDGPDPVATETSSDTVMVRRAPRYGRFILLGAVVGAVVALILTFSFSGQPSSPNSRSGSTAGQVFGFLLLLCGTIGAALGAVVALILDRVFAHRISPAIAEHESTHRIDD